MVETILSVAAAYRPGTDPSGRKSWFSGVEPFYQGYAYRTCAARYYETLYPVSAYMAGAGKAACSRYCASVSSRKLEYQRTDIADILNLYIVILSLVRVLTGVSAQVALRTSLYLVVI